MAGIIYQPLNAQQREIRLLSLLPTSSNEPVSCRLETTSLLAPPRYQALSYVWGNAVPSISSVNTVSLNSTPVLVTTNLHLALRHLHAPSSGPPLCLWVDSLCINQQDTAERSQQVTMMREIYAGAEKVVIWLGEGDSEAETAFDALALCVKPADSGADEEHRLNAMRRSSSFFFTLADQFPWFNRIWILQELAVARADPLVICGRRSAPWSLLVKAWDAIAQEVFVEIGLVRPPGQQKNPEYSNKEAGNAVASSGRQVAVRDESNIIVRPKLKIDVLHDLRKTTQLENRETLAKLLRLSRSSESSDPRDRIYGLIGLMGDHRNNGISIPIDYEKSASEVYTDAMIHMFSRGEGLYFLSSSFLPGLAAVAPRITSLQPTTLQPNLPSWVPDFSRQIATAAAEPSSVSFHPPAIPGSGGASGSGAECVNGKCLDDKRTLQVEGLRVDCVEQVVPFGSSLDACIAELPHLEVLAKHAREQPVDSAVFGQAAAYFVEQFKKSEPLWKILISNKLFNSGYDAAPQAYADMYNNLLNRQAGTSLNKPDSERSEYELCLKAGVNKRSFFVSDNGFVGTCVPETRAGDVIAILFGSPVPFILRQLGQPGHIMLNGSEKQVHGLVGAAYVGGIMNGEMVDDLYCEDLMDSTTFFIQ